MDSVIVSSSKSAVWSVRFAAASVVLLLVGYFTLFWVPYLGWASGVLAILFGVKTIAQTNDVPAKDRTMANIGAATGVVSLVYLVFAIGVAVIQGK
jgi:hypothetical protein